MTSPRRALALALFTGLVAPSVLAQPGKAPAKPAAAPATPPKATTPIPDPNALPTKGLPDLLLKRETPRAWTVRAQVAVGQMRTLQNGQAVQDSSGPIRIRTATVLFPAPMHTANADFTVGPDFKGELRADGNLLSSSPSFIDGYPGGARFAKWTFADLTPSVVRLEVYLPYVCSRTTVDEDLARKVPWPAQMPPIAASTFQPQLGVEFTQEMGYTKPHDPKFPSPDEQVKQTAKVIKERLERWTNKQDLKKLPPYDVAKMVTSAMLQEVQISGNGYNTNRDGSLQGFELKGALATLNDGRGSPYDLVCALTACLRTAGLPARTVIGLDATGDRDNNRLKNRGGGGEKLYAWVEFALVDPSTGQEIWIPIDVIKLRGAPSRLNDPSRPWTYFGTHKDLDAFLPLALQFHPPTTVSAYGSPALWGWNVEPGCASMDQSVNFFAYKTPVTGKNDPAAPKGPSR